MKIRFVFLVLVSAILFSACSYERLAAMEYMKKGKERGSILLVPPYALDLINKKLVLFDTAGFNQLENQDSGAFYSKLILEKFSDSVFLEMYLNSFIAQLQGFGYKVLLPDELYDFQTANKPAYIFRFAQTELAEESSPFIIDEKILDQAIYKKIDLNLVRFSNWFEFESRDSLWKKIFYAEDAIEDRFSGELVLDQSLANPVFVYQMDSLSIQNVNQMAQLLGVKYAEFLNDYLMNVFIKQKFPSYSPPKLYFHFDSELKMLSPYQDRFVELNLSK
ncbi:MAG TPA: hypothetical protein DCG69_03585 [Bacteroidales bacterium]|nr:hypothetical protein [Bacteroidales bacterium]